MDAELHKASVRVSYKDSIEFNVAEVFYSHLGIEYINLCGNVITTVYDFLKTYGENAIFVTRHSGLRQLLSQSGFPVRNAERSTRTLNISISKDLYDLLITEVSAFNAKNDEHLTRSGLIEKILRTYYIENEKD